LSAAFAESSMPHANTKPATTRSVRIMTWPQ
jgi:hypothetical protein